MLAFPSAVQVLCHDPGNDASHALMSGGSKLAVCSQMSEKVVAGLRLLAAPALLLSCAPAPMQWSNLCSPYAHVPKYGDGNPGKQLAEQTATENAEYAALACDRGHSVVDLIYRPGKSNGVLERRFAMVDLEHQKSRCLDRDKQVAMVLRQCRKPAKNLRLINSGSSGFHMP